MLFGTTISDDDLELLLQCLLVLLVLSISIWYIFLRGPTRPKPDDAPNQQQHHNIPSTQNRHPQQQQHQPNPTQNATAATTANARQRQPTGGTPGRHRPPGGGGAVTNNGDDSVSTIAALSVRSPPHTNSSYHAQVAHDGVIPFRYTKASVFESRSYGGGKAGEEEKVAAVSTARQMANRKERARIFTKLFSSTRTEKTGITQPPSRGSNIVITVPSNEVRCPKLRKVLFLLGSYYNLFLIVATDDNNNNNNNDATKEVTETEQFLKFQSTMTRIETSLRGDGGNDEAAAVLPPEILPSHRIVGTTSIEGRVAFVRQFPKRPEFVLDYDGEVHSQLTRFGFGVLLYSKLDRGGGGGDGVCSGVGKELIP